MKQKIISFFKLTKKSAISWNNNEPFQNAATIAYYALFSLPSLLMIVVSIAGYFYGRKAVQGRITSEIGQYIGQDSASAVQEMIGNAALSSQSTLAIIFGVAMLLFGATGVFFQLKITMNKIWNVTEKKSNFVRMLIDRVISFGMVLVIGFLLLISLIISTLLNIIEERIVFFAPSVTSFVLNAANYCISFLVITTLFAAVFKLLPDVKIRWKITYYGAALTTILFLVGESLLSLYFGKTSPASVYGGASSVVLILLWVYYTCLILFFGAEFTVQYALMKNEKIEPSEHGEAAIYEEMRELEAKKTQSANKDQLNQSLKENSNRTKSS